MRCLNSLFDDFSSTCFKKLLSLGTGRVFPKHNIESKNRYDSAWWIFEKSESSIGLTTAHVLFLSDSIFEEGVSLLGQSQKTSDAGLQDELDVRAPSKLAQSSSSESEVLAKRPVFRKRFHMASR